jgi:hypothetical protein
VADSSSKCLKHQIGKKSAMGDKPAVGKVGMAAALDTSRMPLVRGVSTVEEYGQQQAVVSYRGLGARNSSQSVVFSVIA